MVQKLRLIAARSDVTSSSSSPPFKKFRTVMPLPRRSARNHFSSITKATSTSQMMTRKLLRSMKRRESLKGKQKTEQRTNLKRKLYSDANTSKANSFIKSKTNTNESEIVLDCESSIVDTVAPSKKSRQYLDDDCICIEPHIEHITIDDEDEDYNMSGSSGAAPVLPSSKVKNKPSAMTVGLAMEAPSTSTPNQNSARKKKKAKKEDTVSQMIPPPLPLFFKDVSQGNWCESINSVDTFINYTLRGKNISKRRSQRLKQPHSTANHTINDDDVIVLDEASNDSTLMAEQQQRQGLESSVRPCGISNSLDASVIFIGESNADDFIPLSSGTETKKVQNTFSPKMESTPKVTANKLFTKSERKQLNAYNDNAYNPAADKVPNSQKRMVIIDGSNVAFSHGLGQEFSMKGLKITIDFFEKMGHETKAVVPQFRLQRSKSTDQQLLERLHREGKIVLTPCKVLNGMTTTSYDDRFILQLACTLDAAIVSNDNYRDLINENSAFKKIIENRVVGYTWCNDIFILPKDPYGRWGPTLRDILNRT